MTAPGSTTKATTEPRRRLHPLSPVLRGGRLTVLAIAAISWQGYQGLGTQRWLLAIAAVCVLVLVGSVVSYLVTGYHVVGRELRIYEGVLARRTRSIPVERLQSVELVRPLLARALGLAELRLEVVGGAKTEAPLAFLSNDDAVALRRRLLSLAQIGTAAASAAAPASPSALASPEASAATGGPAPVSQPERPVHRILNRDLFISQLLRPQWFLLPLAIAAPIVFFTVEADIGFFAFASMLTAIVGAIAGPVRGLLNDWNFTLGVAIDGLRIRRGLLETRNQTVPPGRVQQIVVQWPLFWRHLGWVRASMHVAGVSGGQGAEQRAGLLPVGTVPTAELVIAEALPGFTLRAVAVHEVPRRAAWLAPLRRRVLGYQLTETAFVTRSGLLTRELVIVAYGRIQSVRVRQGPLQRMLRLASVWVDTAGGVTQAVAPHRDVAEARDLATELANRSRAARRTPPGPPAAPAPYPFPAPPPPPAPSPFAPPPPTT